MLIIGEKINSSIPSVADAIQGKDALFIQKLALDQVNAGANIIDVNAGAFLDEEKELLCWLVNVVQEVTDVPLCIDSPNPEALEAAVPLAKKRPIINSISAEEDRYNGIIPLIKRYPSGVIALCMDDRGIPTTAGQRIQIAQKLTERLDADGVSRADIFLDVMVQPIGTDGRSGLEVLETVRAIRKKISGVHITCGLSNVSFGLPKRRLLNQAFAVCLAAYGMDTMFIDPLDEKMMALLRATDTLTGCDDYCCRYLTEFRAGKLI